MIFAKYWAQADLLLQVLPHVAKEKIFALKGGTAINLFVLDMPRLSVDIDLTYLPFDDRSTALHNISEGLSRIKQNLEKSVKNLTVTPALRENEDIKLHCQLDKAQIKIEVNSTTRGIIQPVRLLQVSETVQKEFKKFAAINVVSQAELYGGKICAALDRQHPRDLFDVHLLFENEGYTDDIKIGFLTALLSHMRPINEVLFPHLSDQKETFENQFSGMTAAPFSYEEYENTRKRLLNEIHSKLKETDKSFLLSFKNGEPDWKLFPVENLKDFPAVKWKLENLKKLKETNPKKHAEFVKVLEEKLKS
ncbi:MAG: nucleotidyl transferase AbiEii/AbiGii toxin family protein [Bacteroidales bacterium]|nr:nucleotidyl transferase AbiEii/AbiGii toxin family protein [Bacteroidales bacterium]